MLHRGELVKEDLSWMILIYKVPAEPSTLRVRAWRKIKDMGALYLQQSVAIYPKINHLAEEFTDLVEEIKTSGGEALLFEVINLSGEGEKALISKFNEQRDLEYRELMDKCEDFFDEIKKETARQNFTFAELEENDEELEKLSRWYEKIKERDFFEASMRQKAEEMLARCREMFFEFAQTIYKKEGTM
jgi:DNA-binding transcriptional regulator PaaX